MFVPNRTLTVTADRGRAGRWCGQKRREGLAKIEKIDACGHSHMELDRGVESVQGKKAVFLCLFRKRQQTASTSNGLSRPKTWSTRRSWMNSAVAKSKRIGSGSSSHKSKASVQRESASLCNSCAGRGCGLHRAPILSARLLESTKLVLSHVDKTANQIFGPTDDLKFFSSMTLFAAVRSRSIFQAALDHFDKGVQDGTTLAILDKWGTELRTIDFRLACQMWEAERRTSQTSDMTQNGEFARLTTFLLLIAFC